MLRSDATSRKRLRVLRACEPTSPANKGTRAVPKRWACCPTLAPAIVPKRPHADAAQMFEDASAGKLDVLSLFGVNPVRNAADGEAIARALAAIPFLAVSELFLTETAQLATLVLPAKGAFEKFGTTTALTGQVLDVRASIEAPAGVLSDLEMLIGLAESLDVELPSQETLDRAVAESAAAASDSFGFGSGPFAWSNRRMLRRPRRASCPAAARGATTRR